MAECVSIKVPDGTIEKAARVGYEMAVDAYIPASTEHHWNKQTDECRQGWRLTAGAIAASLIDSLRKSGWTIEPPGKLKGGL